MRQLAEQLADAGFMVLRFEYLGQGDSSGDQNDPDAVQQWIVSVEHAVQYLRESGVTEVGLVGLRAGSLIAANAAKRVGSLRALVLWDPIPTGRAYVREQTAYYRMSMREDTSDNNIVSFIGGTFAAEAIAVLGKLTINPTDIETPGATLVVQRREHAGSERLRKISFALAADVQTVDHQEAFVTPSSFLMSVPTNDIKQIASWMSGEFAATSMLADPEIRSRATVGRMPDGSPVYETLERRGSAGLLTIVTAPSSENSSGTVILHSTASEHRIGPARLWVEQARELAAIGVRSARFDRRGTGDSGTVAPDECTPPIGATARADALDLVDALGIPAHHRLHVGLCSGAWLSAYTADQCGAAAVVLINNVNWSLQNLRLPIRKAQVDALHSSWANRALIPLRALRNFGRRLQTAIPYRLWLAISNAGYLNAPESLLAQLNKKQIHTTVMLSPEDLAWFNSQRGEVGMNRMRSAGVDSTFRSYPSGDHTLYEHEIRTAVRAGILRAAEDTFLLRPPRGQEPPTHGARS